MSNPYQTLSAQRKEPFRDFDLSFRRNPVTNDLLSLDTEGSIKQSLKNLVLTSFYESPKQVGFGTNVKSSLFENYSWELEYWIRRAIARVILANESERIVLNNVVVGTDQDQTIRIKIEYTITGRLGKRSFDLVFDRVR